MRVTSLALLVVVVSSITTRADGAADARAVVARALRAAGVKDVDNPVAMTWKDKGTFIGGGVTMPYSGEWAFQGPDQYRFEITGEINGAKIQFQAVISGNRAWEAAMGKTREITGQKLEQIVAEVYQLNVLSLVPLIHGGGYELSFAEEKEVNGKRTTGVKVEHAKRPTITLYFDKETGLLVKDEMIVKDEFQGWKEAMDEGYFEDYKEVDGRKFFTKMHITRNGAPMIETTLFGQKTAEKLDSKLFDKP